MPNLKYITKQPSPSQALASFSKPQRADHERAQKPTLPAAAGPIVFCNSGRYRVSDVNADTDQIINPEFPAVRVTVMIDVELPKSQPKTIPVLRISQAKLYGYRLCNLPTAWLGGPSAVSSRFHTSLHRDIVSFSVYLDRRARAEISWLLFGDTSGSVVKGTGATSTPIMPGHIVLVFFFLPLAFSPPFNVPCMSLCFSFSSLVFAIPSFKDSLDKVVLAR